MSDADDLQALADKVVAQAQAGEQIEAYVSRGGETEVRVYGGEVEHFVSAQSEGIGVRVIRDGRTGFAYAGTLDPGAVDEVLAEARDNVTFGTVDEWAGLAEPDGVARTAAAAVGRRAGRVPDRAQDRAGQGARAADARRRPAHPRRRRQLRRRVGRGRRGHDDRHPRERPGERLLRQRQQPRRRRRRDADRVRLQRRPPARRCSTSTRRPATPSTGRPACSAPPSRPSKRLTVVLDPFVTAQFLGVISSTLNGESVVKGRSLFRDRLGEQVAAERRDARRRPDQPRRLHRHRRRRRGPRRPPQRPHRGRRAAALRALQLLGPPGRHRVDRQRHARRVRRHARRRLPRPAAAAGHPRPGGADRRRRRRPARAVGRPACTPASTRSAATSRPARRGCSSRTARSARRCAS